MFPIRDSIPSRRVAWITRALLIANVLVFALELRHGAHVEAFISRFGVVPAHWVLASPVDLARWPSLSLTLLTSQFLHGGFFHLGSNLLFLWIFGDNVEDWMGHGRFLWLYLVSGVVAATAQIVVSPHSIIPLVGASGAIAGVLGAYVLLYPGARIVTLVPMGFFLETVELPAVVFLGLWFVLQWVQGLITIGQVADVGGVAFWAHIGGFMNGMLWVLVRRRRPRW